jgi:uncharacterized protein
MSIVSEIRGELLKRVEAHKEKTGYDSWNSHVKYVVENAVKLAKRYNADVEIVELGALLHDIAMPSEVGPREEHHIYGAKIAEELLSERNYPRDRIERVKKCVLNHRGSKDLPRETIEEECVADADVIAHFDNIPLLFGLAYRRLQLSQAEGEQFVKDKLARDYRKLSDHTRAELKDRYENIVEVLFGHDRGQND